MKYTKVLVAGPIPADVYEQLSRRNSFVDFVNDFNADVSPTQRIVNVNGELLLVTVTYGAGQDAYDIHAWKENGTKGEELMHILAGANGVIFQRKMANGQYEPRRSFPTSDIKDALVNLKSNRLFLRISKALYDTLSITTRNHLLAFFSAASGVFGPIDIIPDSQNPIQSITKELQKAVEASKSAPEIVGYTKSIVATFEERGLIYEKPPVLLPIITPLSERPLRFGTGQLSMGKTADEVAYYDTTIQPSLSAPSLRKIGDTVIGVNTAGLTTLSPYLLEQMQWIVNRLNPSTSRRFPQKPKPALIQETKLLINAWMNITFQTLEKANVLLCEPTYVDVFRDYNADLKFDYVYDGKEKVNNKVQLMQDIRFEIPAETDIRFLGLIDVVAEGIQEKLTPQASTSTDTAPTDEEPSEMFFKFAPYQALTTKDARHFTIPKYTILPIDKFAPAAHDHTDCTGKCKQVISKTEIKDGVAWLKKYLSKPAAEREGAFLLSPKVVLRRRQEFDFYIRDSMIITTALQATEPAETNDPITESHTSSYLPQILIPEASPPSVDRCLGIMETLADKLDFLKATVKILLAQKLTESKKSDCRFYCELLRLLEDKINPQIMAQLLNKYAAKSSEHCFEVFGILQFWQDVANKEPGVQRLRLFDRRKTVSELTNSILVAIKEREKTYNLDAHRRVYPELPVMLQTRVETDVDEIERVRGALKPLPFYMGVTTKSGEKLGLVSTVTLLKIHAVNVLNDPQTRVFFNQINLVMSELNLANRLRDLPAEGVSLQLKAEQKLPQASHIGNKTSFDVLTGNIFDKRLGGKHWSDEERELFQKIALKYRNASSRAAFLQMHRWLDLYEDETLDLEEKMAGAFMNALERVHRAYVPYSAYEQEKLVGILPPSYKEQIRIYQRGQHYIPYRAKITDEAWKELKDGSHVSGRIRESYDVYDIGVPEHFFDIKGTVTTGIADPDSNSSKLNFWMSYFQPNFEHSKDNKTIHLTLYDLINFVEYDVVNNIHQ